MSDECTGGRDCECVECTVGYCQKCGSCGILDCCGHRCLYREEHAHEYEDMKRQNAALWRLWQWYRKKHAA